MLIYTYFSLNKLHFRYDKQLKLLRPPPSEAEKYICKMWGEADIAAHMHLPPS
jgi:hypothetical protein